MEVQKERKITIINQGAKRGEQRQRAGGRICYVAITQYFILGPCVVYYLLLLCFCPTSSTHTRRANNTPAKLIGNTHTHTPIHTNTLE